MIREAQTDFLGFAGFLIFDFGAVSYFTPMIAPIASSKLNGWSETGFAFGMMAPPMVNATASPSVHTSSEHASPATCSASCYDRAKDIRFLAVVVTERELGQVQRQVGLADLVIGADHAPLEQAPEAIQVRRVDIPAHIFALRMAHRLMRIADLVQFPIAAVVISRDQRDIGINRLLHKAAHRFSGDGFNDLGHNIAFASNRANDGDFAAASCSRATTFLAPVPVLILAADIGFIDFDFAHELAESSVLHRRSDAMAHIPGRPVVAAADLPMDLQGADPLLTLRHQVDHLEPDRQGIVRVLENGLANDGEAIAVPSAALFAFADPMKRLALQCVHFLVLATRALHAVGPAFLGEKLLARFFCREAFHQAAQGHCLLGHDPLRCWREYSAVYRVVSSAT